MNVKFKIGIKEKLASQPKVAGAWYLCKDVGELYYCDGDGDNGKFVLVDASNNLKELIVTAGNGLTGGGTVNINNKSITISHGPKPTNGNDAGGNSPTGAFVTGVDIDEFGHVVATTKGGITGGGVAPDGKYIKSIGALGNTITTVFADFPKVDNASQADNATNASHATEADHSATSDEAEKVSNKLTFTGHEDKSYDGSEAISVAIPTAYTGTPKMNGTAAQGTSTSWAKGDHVHPSDTSRLSLSTFNTFLSKSITVAVSYKHPATTSNSVSITATTHGCGTNPIVQVLNSNGEVVTCGITIDSTGKVTVTQNEGVSISVIIKGEKSITFNSLFMGIM